MLWTYRSAIRLALIGTLFGTAACGKDPDPDPTPKPTDSVKVDSFTATPGAVAPGTTTALDWAVSGTGSAPFNVVITAAPGGALPATDMAQGTINSGAITENTTFTLVVTKGTASAMRQISVTVDANAVAISSFTATPNPATRGGQVTLSWVTVGAMSIKISEGTTDLHTNSTTPLAGSFAAPVPNASHTFKLTATNASGSVERTVTVTTTAPIVETEPNNTPATATPVTGGANGTITDADVDFYSITVPANGNVFAEITDGKTPVGCELDSQLKLIDSDMTTEIATNDDGGIGPCSKLDPLTNAALANLPAGTYYISVGPSPFATTATGAYALSLSIGSPSCGNHLREGTEMCDDGNLVDGDGCSQTCTIMFAGMVTGTPPQTGMFDGVINPANDQDNYQVTMPVEGFISVETGVPTIGLCTASTPPAPPANDTLVILLDSNGDELARNDDIRYPENPCSFLNPSVTPGAHVQAGTYTVRVISYQGGGGQVIQAYQVRIKTFGLGCGNSITEMGTEQCDDGNTTPGDGCDATCNYEISSTLNPPGGDAVVTVPAFDPSNPPIAHFIGVNVNEGQSLTATTSDGAGNCPFETRLYLYNNDFSTLLGEISGGGGCAYIDPKLDDFARELPAGLYHVGVRGEGPTGGAVTITVGLIDRACGNGIIESGGTTAELCDDGNTANGDGCSSTCSFELAGTVNPPTGSFTLNLPDPMTPNQLPKFIGVNITDPTQSVRVTTSNGTGTTCTVQPDVFLVESDFQTVITQALASDTTSDCTVLNPIGTPADPLPVGMYIVAVQAYHGMGNVTVRVDIVTPGCGNGFLDVGGTPAEVCDDGNTTNGDGCSNMCRPEATAINATRGGAVVTTQGALTPGEVDTYSFVVPAGMTATLEAVTYVTAGMPAAGCMDPDDTILTLLDANFVQIVENDDTTPGSNLCSTLTGDPMAANLAAGTYYLQVTQFQGANAPDMYFLDVRLVP